MATKQTGLECSNPDGTHPTGILLYSVMWGTRSYIVTEVMIDLGGENVNENAWESV